MNNCLCGLPVRLGANRIVINRKRGVAHYVSHLNETACRRPDEYKCFMMKPYPAKDEDKEWFKMIMRWNAENPVEGQP